MKRIYFVFTKCGLVRLVAASLLIVYYTTHLKIAICRATGFTGQAIIGFSELAEKEGNRRSCRDVVVTRVYIHYVTRINAFVQRSRYPLMSRVYRKANGTRCKKRRESHVDRATAGTCDNAIEILTRGKHNTDRECSNFTK